MSCKKPLIRITDLNKPYKTIDGKTSYKSYITRATDTYDDKIEQMFAKGHYKYDLIACGQCINCRLDYSREWANRGYLEAKLYKENYFVTLTYDELNLKRNEVIRYEDGKHIRSTTSTLDKSDLQKFIKNVRQKKDREYKKQLEEYENGKRNEKPIKPNIRYMACGEYGEENQRGHFHIIFFNLHLEPKTFYKPKIKEGITYWQNTFIEECWTEKIAPLDENGNRKPKGICNICEANWNTIAYVARYITKKVKGPGAEEEYIKRGQEREFLTTSRNHGIGYDYYQKYKEEIYKNDEILIKNNKGVVSSKPPKYFDEMYEKEEPEKFKKIQRKRKKQALRQARLKDTLTSLSRQQQYDLEERTKEIQTKSLKRTYIDS